MKLPARESLCSSFFFSSPVIFAEPSVPFFEMLQASVARALGKSDFMYVLVLQ